MILYQRLLDDRSNTAWTYCTSSFMVWFGRIQELICYGFCRFVAHFMGILPIILPFSWGKASKAYHGFLLLFVPLRLIFIKIRSVIHILEGVIHSFVYHSVRVIYIFIWHQCHYSQRDTPSSKSTRKRGLCVFLLKPFTLLHIWTCICHINLLSPISVLFMLIIYTVF